MQKKILVLWKVGWTPCLLSSQTIRQGILPIRLFNLSSTTVLHLALALAISALKWLTGRKRWCVRPLCKLYHRQSRDRWYPHLGASRIPMEKTKKIRFLVRHSRHYQDSILGNGIKEVLESHINSNILKKVIIINFMFELYLNSLVELIITKCPMYHKQRFGICQILKLEFQILCNTI